MGCPNQAALKEQIMDRWTVKRPGDVLFVDYNQPRISSIEVQPKKQVYI